MRFGQEGKTMSKRPVLVFIITLVASMLTVKASLQSVGAQIKYKKPEPVAKPTPSPTPYTPPYLPGEVKMAVKAGEHPVIRLALAGSGVTVVEFPATDRFVGLHPPQNGDWVVIENSPTLKTDHHVVLRAGKDLMNATGAAASLSVQMCSGLLVTIWLYPVKMVWSQTHRFVLSYDRDDILAARQRAGLAVNLCESEKTETLVAAANDASSAKPSSNTPTPSPPPAAPAQNSENQAQPQEAPRLESQPAAAEQIRDKLSEKREKRLRELRNMLGDVVVNPKSFKDWTDATNGLSVATKIRDLDDDTQVALVAVKNVEDDEALRIMTGHPELVVQTLDKKGRIIQLESVKKLDEASSTTNNIIPAKSTVYYAIAFSPPILGKLQRLRVTVGQRNAADDPAIANLSSKK